MKQTTQAIVLGLRKHSDKLSVLQVYSRTEGRLSLQVYGAMSKHKVRAAYQPLSVVEITYDNQPTRTMATLQQIDPLYLPERIYADVRRQTISMFVTEMLMLTLSHPMQDEQMYQFVDDYVHELNDTREPENMHIEFMLRLAGQLGIGVPETIGTPTSRIGRQNELLRLCDYYREHIEAFRAPKSLDILIEIFD